MSGGGISFYLLSGFVWTLATLVIVGWIAAGIVGLVHITRGFLDPNYPGERE